jgi:spectinomycin phosphotransferase
MLEKPNLSEARIADWLLDHYGLRVVEVEFLPTNYQNTAAYRVVTEEKSYFLKLRRDVFEETSVRLPLFLRDLGLPQIIAPVATRSREYWANLDDFNVILYPFVTDHNAFKVALTEHQWIDFGSALKKIHSTLLPPELSSQIQHETYSRAWSEQVKMLVERAQKDKFDEPVAAQLAVFMITRASEILHLVRRAEQLSLFLQMQPPEFVLCHSDIHAGNILCNPDGGMYIVDWDNPIMAPKERDLMFIGGGVGGIWNSAQEESIFYRGYGKTEINTVALAYYRFERILQDIGPNAGQLLLMDTGSKDRVRTLQGIISFFLPNGVVEMACKAEKILPQELRQIEYP